LALVILCLNLPGVRGLFGMELWSGFYPRLWLDPLRYLAAMFCLITAIGAPGRWVIGGPLVFLGRISRVLPAPPPGDPRPDRGPAAGHSGGDPPPAQLHRLARAGLSVVPPD
ncbi:MAG: hypothetical protein AAFV27_06310, partial [Pseudomonadota bacterium]